MKRPVLVMSDKLTINNNGQPIYDIVYRNDFNGLRDFFHEYYPDKMRRVCIVSDSKVASVYMDAILSITKDFFKKTVTFIFPEGEQSKNLDTVRSLYVKLIEEQFDRKDLLIALGGGVTGDMCGYTAATYLRGVDFIQIPTSLLADVDSSIGGKTGVDFDSYKNMVGAFHMPKLVYINTATLNTLDERQFYSGMGEVVKSALIKDYEFFEWIENNADSIRNISSDSIKEMIYKCNIVKKNVVEADPYETLGERALLNFGHTLGHAIEKYMNFEMLHGECVSVGCVLAAYISCKKGFIDKEKYERIFNLFSSYMHLRALPEDVDIEKIIKFTKNDKKADAGKVKFILLSDIGNSFISMDVTDEDMRDSLNYYLTLKELS